MSAGVGPIEQRRGAEEARPSSEEDGVPSPADFLYYRDDCFRDVPHFG